MLCAWGRFRSEYEALPGPERREMFKWWKFRVERERMIQEKRRLDDQFFGKGGRRG